MEGLKEMIMPFFDVEVLDYIREPEVDARFIHFTNEFKDPDNNLKFDYWECIKLQRRKEVDSKSGNDKKM